MVSTLHFIGKGSEICSMNNTRGMDAVTSHGKEANQLCDTKTKENMSRGRRPFLMDTPIRELIDSDFLQIFKAEVANLTPRQLLNQQGHGLKYCPIF